MRCLLIFWLPHNDCFYFYNVFILSLYCFDGTFFWQICSLSIYKNNIIYIYFDLVGVYKDFYDLDNDKAS
jgi:hypothetical protein